MSSRRLAFDVLDGEEGTQQRWIMYYRDGRVRRSQYRHDLIRNPDSTRITPRGKNCWGGTDCDFEIYDGPLSRKVSTTIGG